MMKTKRTSGDGCVQKRKNGTWYAQIMVGYKPDGTKRRKCFSGKTKAEVTQKLRKYQEQMEQHIEIDQTMTFGAWAKIWYEDMKGQVQASTYCNYRYTLALLLKAFENKKLTEILPMQINQFYRSLEKDYSRSQITKCKAMLMQIYDAADDNGLIVRNPARHSKIGKDTKVLVSKKDAFTKEEIDALLKYLPEDLLGMSIRLLLGTGLRVQELLALTKEDISEDGSTVVVNKAVKTVNGRSTLGMPKSSRSYRTVPVPARYRPYAIWLREHGAKPYLWTRSTINPLYSVKTFRSGFLRAVKAVPGVRTLTPHCTRHTYITVLETRGVPTETVMRLVGHSRAETTSQYTHLTQDTLAAAVSVLDKEERI